MPTVQSTHTLNNIHRKRLFINRVVARTEDLLCRVGGGGVLIKQSRTQIKQRESQFYIIKRSLAKTVPNYKETYLGKID